MATGVGTRVRVGTASLARAALGVLAMANVAGVAPSAAVVPPVGAAWCSLALYLRTATGHAGQPTACRLRSPTLSPSLLTRRVSRACRDAAAAFFFFFFVTVVRRLRPRGRWFPPRLGILAVLPFLFFRPLLRRLPRLVARRPAPVVNGRPSTAGPRRGRHLARAGSGPGRQRRVAALGVCRLQGGGWHAPPAQVSGVPRHSGA